MEQLINGRTGLSVAAFIARATPPGLGRLIASQAARWFASRRDSTAVKAVRENQRIVAAEAGNLPDLDRSIRAVFQNSAFSIYELYHYLHNPEKAGRLFVIEPSFQPLINRPEFDRRGLVIAGLHMSGFDLALQWLCMNWIKPLVLTIPNPQGGRLLEFEIRRKTGMNLMPASVPVLRQAIRHLEQGGMVATGIDRPVPGCKPRPKFFGQPANLPAHHIHLALQAGSPVVVAVSRLHDDGRYHLHASDPIELDDHPDRGERVLRNTEKVLAAAEAFIRQAPQQWIIFQPVWADSRAQASNHPGPVSLPGGEV